MRYENEKVQFMRKGKFGDWKHYLNLEQSKMIDDKFQEYFKETEADNWWQEENMKF